MSICLLSMRVARQIIYGQFTRIHISTASHCACAKTMHISLLSILQNDTWQTPVILNVRTFTLRCTLLNFGYEHCMLFYVRRTFQQSRNKWENN